MSKNKLTLLVTATAFGIGLALLLYRTGQDFEKRLNADGVQASVDTHPTRIAVLSTAAEEILIAIGAENLIVGTSGFSALSNQTTKFPRIGGIMDINFEMLTRLSPDLIIAQTNDQRLERFSKERHIRFMRIDIERVADVLHLTQTLGEITGHKQAGIDLANKISADLDHARQLSGGREKVPCFVSVDRSPGHMTQILTTGKTTFVSELLDIAGCRNVFGDLNARYPAISKESLAARAPEVIVELKPDPNPRPTLATDMISDWRQMNSIPAVANGRIRIITHDAALIAGPRMAEVAVLITQALHPNPVAGTTGADERPDHSDAKRP